MEANVTVQGNLYTRKIRAGKRTYFFDVKQTKSGTDFFIVITESRRTADKTYQKRKLFLYKEDFEKFLEALADAISHTTQCCLKTMRLDRAVSEETEA
jgi:hypothetical protein